MKEDTPAASRKQDESRRIGHEAATKEVVAEAKADTKSHDAARKARFAATGEPSAASCYEDVAE